MLRPIHTDGPFRLFPQPVFSMDSGDHGLDDGADAFMKLWNVDAAKPSDDESEKETKKRKPAVDPDESDERDESPRDDDEDEDDTTDADESDNDDEEDEKPAPRKQAEDDHVVKLKVGDEELEVPVKDLKRLYGQEAALTRKSQEVADQRKAVETETARYTARAEKLLAKAQERFAPYAQIDWLVAAKELEADDLQALRTEAQKAYEDMKFLETDIDAVLQEANQTRHQSLVQEARETIKELSDPEKGIPGFGEKLYTEMKQFALDQGIPVNVVNEIVSAPIYRLLHKAMMFDKGSKATTSKVDKKPKKIVKSKTNSDTNRSAFKGDKGKDAIGKLRQTGSQDDAAKAFLAKWADED